MLLVMHPRSKGVGGQFARHCVRKCNRETQSIFIDEGHVPNPFRGRGIAGIVLTMFKDPSDSSCTGAPQLELTPGHIPFRKRSPNKALLVSGNVENRARLLR